MVGAPEQAVPRSIGRYVLYGEIAAGGMATVHFGRLVGPAGFSRPVAIKRLHPQLARDPEFVTMFLDEARLAARIFHPNVVPTLDVVAIDSELFLVMEYVRGAPLSRLMRGARSAGGRILPRIVTSILSGVLHGLHAAHEATDEQGQRLDIVHRDVSPQNVLVGIDGVARVLDFGVAKAAGRLQTTRDGQLKGKLSYMAPEQVRGTPVTRQTDVYAASVVLWEALTGERLFKAENEAHVLAKVLDGDVRPPSQIVEGLPVAFDSVVARGIDRDPGKRYATAREMAQALEACVGGASIAEVGEWVQAQAAEDLTMRAERIAEIERSDSDSRASRRDLASNISGSGASSVPEPTVPAGPGARRAARGSEPPTAVWPGAKPKGDAPIPRDVGSGVSSVSLAQRTAPPPAAASPRPRRGLMGIAAVALGLGAITVVLAVAVVVGRGAFGSGARSAAPGDSAGATPPPAVHDPPAIEAIATPLAAVASSAPPPLASTLPQVPPPSASTARMLAAPPKPTSSPDCNPPYTTDERGHLHFKPACL